MKIKFKLEYALLRFIFFVVNILPLALINLLTFIIGWTIWIFCPFRLPVAYDNLSTVFPSLSHSEKLKRLRKAYIHFIQAAGLILVIHRKKVIKMVELAEIGGIEILDNALSQGKGVILTTYHGCWFEAYFAWFSRGSRPTSLIYQQQSNPLCDSFFVKLRQRYGNNLEHIHSLEKLNIYLDALIRNRVVIISLDQNYTDNGTPVTFFNKTFTCARGTALLHLKTKAPILTSVYYIKQNKLHIDFELVHLPLYKEINNENIEEISNISIQKYEETIRTYPEQWFSLFHRLWKKTGYPNKIHRSFKDIFT